MVFIKSIILSSKFWSILIPAIIAIGAFYLTKAKEREAEWRKEKLKLYINFMETLSGITESDITDEGEINFAKACNDLHLLAPINVLNALHEYQNEIRISNPEPSYEKKQKTLETLLFEIRKDLKIKPSIEQHNFKVTLWSSGKKKKNL